MFSLKPNYVTDGNNKKVPVQFNINTYKKIEEILENYGLFQLMREETETPLSVTEAKKYCVKLNKRK